MLVIHGTFQIKADAVDRLLAVLGPVRAATRAEAGCIFYDWSRSLEDAGTFYSTEVWRSREDSDAHMQSDHVKAGFAEVPDMLVGEPHVVGYISDEEIDLLG